MSTDDRPKLSPATRAAQALRHLDGATGSVVPSIDLSSTFARDADYLPRQAYIYGRDGGPTVRHAEAVMADLDGAAVSLMFASGMSAFTALTETLASGDHVIAPRVMYHGGATWLHRLADRRGIAVSFFDGTDCDDMAALVRPGQTRLIWIETPANPNWDVIDIAATAAIARTAGARLAVDCTVSPPCTTRAMEFGADIAFHSGTKYLGGHSDLTAGVLSFRNDDAFAGEVRGIRSLTGGVIAAFEAWLLIRGLRTLFLRYDRASASALTIAQYLATHPGVKEVLYPGLPSHPGHAVAARQMTGGFGGMLSILVRGGRKKANDVARFTEVFIPATSLGGVESLIEHRIAVEGPYSVVPDTLLRISVGIEAVEDLVADLDQALERAGCAI